MFAIPEFLSIPVLNALGSGAVLYPTVGAVLAWMVIAAFVGSAVGLLREGLRAPEIRHAQNTKAAGRPVAPAAPARECCQAA